MLISPLFDYFCIPNSCPFKQKKCRFFFWVGWTRTHGCFVWIVPDQRSQIGGSSPFFDTFIKTRSLFVFVAGTSFLIIFGHIFIDFWLIFRRFLIDFSLIFDHFYKYWLFIDFLIVSGCQKGHFFRTMGDPPWYWKNDHFSTWNPLALQENRKKRKPRKPTFWSFSSFFIKNWKNDQNWSKKCQKKSKLANWRRFFNQKKEKNV